MFTKDGIHTLTNVVIMDSMHVYLLLQSSKTQGFITSNVAQANKKSYYNWHPIDQFLPLAIEVFGCLDKQANEFLHHCTNAIWSFKGPKGPPFSILVTFFGQKISITLQKMQASSILSKAIIVDLTTS
jgi:hypothetical protein